MGTLVVSIVPLAILLAAYRFDKHEEVKRGNATFDNLLENHNLDQLIRRSNERNP